jgi:hypothetical protein
LIEEKINADPDRQALDTVPIPIRISLRQNYAYPTGSGTTTLVP